MAPLPTTGFPRNQTRLVLREVGQRYELEVHALLPVPVTPAEFVLETHVIGLNPIDWKSPDYGFGIPALPFVSGREAYGRVLTLPRSESRLKIGDHVAFISTDYRDYRKATYQQYVIATHFNVVRIPSHVSPAAASAFGVAAVTAVIALSVCGGLDLSSVCDGPDMLQTLRDIDLLRIPSDVRSECQPGLSRQERMQNGDWLAIWGGSSTCAFLINQIARLAGVRTMVILDTAKHGALLASDPSYFADAIIDSKDTARAIESARTVSGGSLRFGVDCVGKITAGHLLQCLANSERENRSLSSSPSSASPADSVTQPFDAHLIGLTGLPNETGHVLTHRVPVKIFHEIEEVGHDIVVWLERLLEEKLLKPPRILGVVTGLEGINNGLDKMRKGEISGGRLVARLRK